MDRETREALRAEIDRRSRQRHPAFPAGSLYAWAFDAADGDGLLALAYVVESIARRGEMRAEVERGRAERARWADGYRAKARARLQEAA